MTKIIELQTENFKRIKAVEIQFRQKGLTVIGGKNAQGKTSVLDSIMFTVGGKKYMPDNVNRKESMSNAYQKVVFDNGIVAERKGKNHDLYVTDTKGMKAGQTLLDSFVSSFALDIAKFMNGDDKAKAKTLLSIIGLDDKLAEMDKEEKTLEQERLFIGRDLKTVTGALAKMEHYEDVPEQPVDTSALLEAQHTAIETNKYNESRRSELKRFNEQFEHMVERKKELTKQLEALTDSMADLSDRIIVESEAVALLKDVDITGISEQIESAAEINAKIAANARYAEMEQQVNDCRNKYNDYDTKIKNLRDSRIALLEGAEMPLNGLTIEDGRLLFKGQPWGNMSGAEQLIVATSIVRKINPECGFVLLDKLEQLDEDTLSEFNTWLETVDLQAIGTRVSTGAECTVIIEDGSVKEDNTKSISESEWNWKGE